MQYAMRTDREKVDVAVFRGIVGHHGDAPAKHGDGGGVWGIPRCRPVRGGGIEPVPRHARQIVANGRRVLYFAVGQVGTPLASGVALTAARGVM
jgi:hypothetical protein